MLLKTPVSTTKLSTGPIGKRISRVNYSVYLHFMQSPNILPWHLRDLSRCTTYNAGTHLPVGLLPVFRSHWLYTLLPLTLQGVLKSWHGCFTAECLNVCTHIAITHGSYCMEIHTLVQRQLPWMKLIRSPSDHTIRDWENQTILWDESQALLHRKLHVKGAMFASS